MTSMVIEPSPVPEDPCVADPDMEALRSLDWLQDEEYPDLYIEWLKFKDEYVGSREPK